MARQSAAQVASPETFAALFDSIVANVSRVIHGKEEPIRLALVCLISEGHLLLEDVPGVGKTTLAKALARSFDLDWRRIQFTPDLLPTDVTGTSVYDRGSSSFTFRPGPVFTNVVIGDEINRASPKTQSALLESMQERQVTLEGVTHRLPSPFLVIGTQNPVEHEGTYPLPESQLDRFLMRIRMGYPDRQAEMTMLESGGSTGDDDVPVVAGADAVRAMIDSVRSVHTAPALKGYVIDLASATRNHPALRLGMSPRAALALQGAARAWAASEGRDYVIPDDVKMLLGPVVEHRLIPSAEAIISGVEVREVLSDILRGVAVPSARSSQG
jgi:MoxR-like ATPase